jgi:hypothetical protein
MSTSVAVISRWLEFTESPQSAGRKTPTWSVFGKRSGLLLGRIRFYPQWRCFVFEPGPRTLFNQECLTDIARFCTLETSKWKAAPH